MYAKLMRKAVEMLKCVDCFAMHYLTANHTIPLIQKGEKVKSKRMKKKNG